VYIHKYVRFIVESSWFVFMFRIYLLESSL